jgi:hypothetical protein
VSRPDDGAAGPLAYAETPPEPTATGMDEGAPPRAGATPRGISTAIYRRADAAGQRQPRADAAGQRQPRFAAGTMIGHCEVIRPLGQGGMGEVFLARDIKLGRLVALKLLTRLSGTRTERFLVEARATARCKHENIVIIYEVGEHDGYLYMVLEYIEGQSLHAWIHERGPASEDPRAASARVPPSLAVELMVPVVRALACAHKLGIVHRDLKPENVMVDASGPIKVLDFGLAKMREAEADPAIMAEDGSATADSGWAPPRTPWSGWSCTSPKRGCS